MCLYCRMLVFMAVIYQGAVLGPVSLLALLIWNSLIIGKLSEG